jgi:hypothetical protein
VLARVACDLDRVTGSGTYAGNFVCSHRAAHAGAVNDNADIGRAFGNTLRDCLSEIGIVNRIFRVGAKIVDLVPKRSQESLQFFFHSEAAVIGADGNQL